ncbi:MAG: hypothetical protein AAFU67_16755, partial [Bacteroidota bacterium]
LLVKFMVAYAENPLDYLHQDEDTGRPERRLEQLREIVLLVKTFNRYIKADALFAPMIMHELAGGNKTTWLKVGVSGKLANRYTNTDALRLLEEAKRMLTLSPQSPGAEPHVVNRRLAENLYASLESHYYAIRVAADARTPAYDTRLALLHCLKAFRVASVLYPTSDLFHELVINELSSEDAALRWFRFDSLGQLIQNEAIAGISEFDAMDHLNYHVAKLNGDADWEQIRSDLIRFNYKRLVRETDELYVQISSPRYRVDQATYLRVQQIVTCLENWLILYYVYNEEGHLDKSLEEILGNEHFHWFAVGQQGLVAQLLPNNLAFDARLYLDRILREKKNVSELASLHTIAKNYFNLYILQRYERLLEKNGRLGKLSEEEYREVWSLLTEATTLYAKVDGDDAYKNFVLDELSKERLMRYFDLGDEEVMTHLQCEKLGLDPLNLVVQLRSRNPTDEHLQAEH